MHAAKSGRGCFVGLKTPTLRITIDEHDCDNGVQCLNSRSERPTHFVIGYETWNQSSCRPDMQLSCVKFQYFCRCCVFEGIMGTAWERPRGGPLLVLKCRPCRVAQA